MSTWKDLNSFRSHELKCAGLRIIVTRHIHHPKDAWILVCDPFYHRDGIKISNGTLEEAKSLAVEIVRKNLEQALAVLNKESTGESS